MLRNQWYVVLESREVKQEPVGCIRLGERLVFWRTRDGRVVCQVDRCAHRGAALAKGKVLPNDRIQCPFHGLEYNEHGQCTCIPANGRAEPVPPQFKVKTYPTYEAQGFIWIYWGDSTPSATPRFFDDIGPEFSWGTVIDPWDNHYSRVIENQLDMAHLPFVHYNTIGRGNRTVVDGPGIMKAEEGFFIYVYNRVDDGSKRRTSEEVPVPNPNSDFKLEFIFPNLWENYISSKVRVLAAFVPVDETHTLMYLRFYQSFMKVPLLKQLVSWLGGKTNLYIAHQDRRVVETQIPKAPGEGTGETLFPGDLPIMEYRKMRSKAQPRQVEAP